MSYLNSQLGAFKSSLASSSTKIANKRTVGAPAASTPSPAPAQAPASIKNDLKRKRVEPTNIVYSQPADTGTGNSTMTQVTYAVEHLRKNKKSLTLQELLLFLSLQHQPDNYKRSLQRIFGRHEKLQFNPEGANGEGTYSFKPIHNIASEHQLLGFLQSQRTAQGLSVKDLKEGWTDVVDCINNLEREGKLLVTRNKKDGQARMVWPNDPSLAIHIDDEFKNIWHKIKLPPADALADELEREGLTPTNKARGVKAKPKVQEKKTKKPRKSGKTTNTHMIGILRDYSHLKK
ncbi:MAG: Transcription initiation factor IIE subunit beta [Icmadophila ericetorum]|nr:Transcription initiation factor IIE subunit beta [Icmadophila ericetorum]